LTNLVSGEAGTKRISAPDEAVNGKIRDLGKLPRNHFGFLQVREKLNEE
jgi:hypothetical protein